LTAFVCLSRGNYCGAGEPGRDQVYYFSHLEIGYTSNDGYHIPDPEYSGPENTSALNEIDKEVGPGVDEEALRKVIDVLENRNRKGMFLAFPYYAERHGGRLLKRALERGHLVGAHLHEDWKKLVTTRDPAALTAYLRHEKERLERAVGAKTTIFSYGPGIQLDDMGGRETPPKYGSLTDDEKKKLFDAVGRAGFRFIQVAGEYQRFLPPDLKPVETMGISLKGISHSFEWHDRRGVLKEFIEKLEHAD
jgi:peptidoglycan/xylan/chitin deacetylase (PgdA/CDA1 family)